MLVWMLVAGCAVPQDEFQSRRIEAYCAWASDCQWYESPEACADAYVDWTPDDACYDAKAAGDCLDALETLQCPNAEEAVEFPDPCNAVYTCPE